MPNSLALADVKIEFLTGETLYCGICVVFLGAAVEGENGYFSDCFLFFVLIFLEAIAL